MAQVETWKSRGGPGKSAGMQPVPWPYYMGGASRGMAQFGATLGQAGTNLLEDHIRDRATEELNNLDVNLTKGWSDYQAWVQTHPNEPDIDGAEFYIEETLDRALGGPSFVLDVASGGPEGFSLGTVDGGHFVSRHQL